MAEAVGLFCVFFVYGALYGCVQAIRIDII
jgi:hypothetical protein